MLSDVPSLHIYGSISAMDGLGPMLFCSKVLSRSGHGSGYMAPTTPQ